MAERIYAEGIYDSRCGTAETNDIVKQLYSNLNNDNNQVNKSIFKTHTD